MDGQEQTNRNQNNNPTVANPDTQPGNNPVPPASHPNPNTTRQNSTPRPQQTNNNGRACFTKDTSGAKRYIPPRVNSERTYWWVGDSRFTGMYINGIIGRKPNEAVVAHAGRGHQWLTQSPTPTGISLLTNCLRNGDVVILNLGANDIWKHSSYISTYRNLMSQYPNVTFRVLSVNPVYDGKARLKNEQIETFNTNLKNAFPGKFIDTYSRVKPMVTASNTDGEGLHYRGGNIEQTIYNTVMASVGG